MPHQKEHRHVEGWTCSLTGGNPFTKFTHIKPPRCTPYSSVNYASIKMEKSTSGWFTHSCRKVLHVSALCQMHGNSAREEGRLTVDPNLWFSFPSWPLWGPRMPKSHYWGLSFHPIGHWWPLKLTNKTLLVPFLVCFQAFLELLWRSMAWKQPLGWRRECGLRIYMHWSSDSGFTTQQQGDL